VGYNGNFVLFQSIGKVIYISKIGIIYIKLIYKT